jgi:hypothetical protein
MHHSLAKAVTTALRPATNQEVEMNFNQPHFTVEQVAEMWNMSRDSVTRLFREEEGTLKITRPGNRYKRTYTTIRIPESVLNRVYGRMTAKAA